MGSRHPPQAGFTVGGRRASAHGLSLRGLTGRTLPNGGWAQNDDVIAVPYVGLGYTDLPIHTGWGFRADSTLMALNPQSAVKFGSALSGGQGIDDMIRDPRLSPLIQIGVPYAF